MITINIRYFANGQNSKWFLFHIYIYMIYFDFESASLKSIMRNFDLFSKEQFLLLLPQYLLSTYMERFP